MSYTSLKYKQIKTKKSHLCFSCLKRFPANVTMVYWTGIYNGDFNSGYTCLTCEEIIAINTKLKAVECGVVEYGFVNEMLSKETTPEMILENLKTK
jgi:hypothetical protein